MRVLRCPEDVSITDSGELPVGCTALADTSMKPEHGRQLIAVDSAEPLSPSARLWKTPAESLLARHKVPRPAKACAAAGPILLALSDKLQAKRRGVADSPVAVGRLGEDGVRAGRIAHGRPRQRPGAAVRGAIPEHGVARVEDAVAVRVGAERDLGSRCSGRPPSDAAQIVDRAV